MNIEEMTLLKDFVEGKIQRDKLENYRGSYKLGFFYTKDLQKAIETLLTAYEKEKEKNKTQPDCAEPVERTEEMVNMRWVNHRFISKDKLKEILGIEETDSEKILSLLQTLVDENNRLEDIEDRKVQIEYNNVFNKGVKSVEDKIKAKIEEIDIEIQCCEYSDDDTEEYKQDIEKEKRRLLRDKAVLQSLLEKE